jgi:large subunit ribosomal protein L25
MEQIVIEAERRTAGGKNANRRLRKSGSIPAVLYGAGKEAVAVTVNPGAVQSILRSQSGQNTIFQMSVDGGEQSNAMVKDYQLDPVKGALIHTDFFEIAMDQLLELTVDIEIVGEAEGVKLAGGIMDMVTRSVEVQCLPSDIPESIKVDVSHLRINEYIRVKNLELNPRVKILTEPEVVLVTILPPIKEEAPAAETPAETSEPELIKKGKIAEEGEGEEQQQGKTK